ncbi:class I adenylate-forming enzyme family protein [Microbacterium sp. No. 7]|uniref:class I adenylate-forming enzyme family protein n=1 Tax=Microbacterium sp. No. 7 TaxID=1714373 RepID=UPI0006D12480|nr:AMP-binding protein [Microbacterium sp. No. 7]ALJ19639.1 AMP-dependent synthetase [Microbacterium sp. No. 7]
MTLAHLPWRSPAAGTDRACLLDVERELGYREVERRAAAFAEQLTAQGVGPGDVIAIMLPNGIELVIALLGAWRVGAAATPVNPTFTERELRYQLQDSGARLLLTTRDGAGAHAPLDVPVIFADELRTTPEGEVVTPDVAADRIALLIYTSGSTGQPKGVMLDHANLDAMATMFARHTELTADDRALLVLPLFHVNSICLSLLAPFSVGASTALVERFVPAGFIAAIERFAPTYFSAVPAVFARLAELPPDVAPDLSGIRFTICGAAPVSKELLQRCADRFGLRILEGYGLTEGTCASACNPLHGVRKLGSVGPALAGQRISITDEAGDPVPAGERGEVRISGPTVMRGYLGRPEATAETVVDGWLRTGDVGILDEDGYLFIVDRIKDMIIRGGENIYPKEIEAFLATHPAVLESAVVGGPHEALGEVPVAYVVLLPGSDADAEELVEHCRSGLTKIKVPARIRIVDALPRNPVGKIDKPELRRRTPAVDVPPTEAVRVV